MRVAFIGNSHIAALKQGWEHTKSEYSEFNVNIDFFGAPKGSILRLIRKERKLVPGNKELEEMISFTSNGMSVIDLDRYDVIVLQALRFSFWYGNEINHLSSSFIEAIDLLNFERSLMAKMLKKVENLTPRTKVLIGHTPIKATPLSVVSHETHNERVEQFNKNCKQLNGAKVVAQPESTIINNCYTALKYTQNSQRLLAGMENNKAGLHGLEDVVHMNADFGREYIKSFLAECIKE